jgi:DNA repair protein RadC
LAIILQTGKRGENVLEFSFRILQKNELTKLAQLELGQLEEILGMGMQRLVDCLLV